MSPPTLFSPSSRWQNRGTEREGSCLKRWGCVRGVSTGLCPHWRQEIGEGKRGCGWLRLREVVQKVL